MWIFMIKNKTHCWKKFKDVVRVTGFSLAIQLLSCFSFYMFYAEHVWVF